MREMIHRGDGEQSMEAHARVTRPSLYDDGLRRILNGDTSVEEVLRVTQEK
jgi:general secretion pathway protein E